MARHLPLVLLIALVISPVSSPSAATPWLTVEPAVCGRASTISVRIRVQQTRYFKVSLRSPCGSSAPYPWTQTLQLPGRDYASGRNTLRFARPIGGWCSGRFRGTVWRNDFTDLTKAGTFAFTIRPHVHT